MFKGSSHDLNSDGSFQYDNGSSNQSQRRNESPNRQYSQYRRQYDQPNNSCPYARAREHSHQRQQQPRNSSSQTKPPLNSTNNDTLEPVTKPRRCHYEILGLERTANQKDIKRAYHKQSLAWHPDKNAHRPEVAEEKFKLISEAYQVLSDDKQKLTYDTYGFDGPPTETIPSFSQENFSSGLFTFPPSRPFFSTPGPPSLFDFFRTGPFSFGPSPGLFRSQPSPFGSSQGTGLDSLFGFGQREPFLDHFEALRSFSSPFSMFPGMSDSSSAFSSFSGFPSSASMTNNSSSSSTSFVNGRYTTYTRTVDSNGNVTTEVRYE